MRLQSAAPVLLTADIDRAVAWYRELGFECDVYGEPPNFGIARRDDVRIMVALCDDAAAIVSNWKIVPNMWNVYVRVDDVDALYAELLERGIPIDYSLYDAPHGMREFGVTDPDGHDIAFGQPLES